MKQLVHLEEQLAKLEGFLALDPQNALLLANIAHLHLRLGQHDRAREKAEKAQMLSSDLALPYAVLGNLDRKLERYSNSAAAFETAMALGWKDPLDHYYYADSLVRIGKYEAAIPVIQYALDFPEAVPFAVSLFLRVLHYADKLDEGIAFGELTAIKGDKKVCSSDFYGALAVLYMDADDLDNAKRTAELALETDGCNIDASTILGQLALGESDYENAIKYFNTALSRSPQNGRVWLGVGLAYLSNRDFNSAAATLEKAAVLLDNHLGALNALAWTHLLNKDLKNAEQAIDRAMEQDRTFAETHGTEAVLHLAKGNLDSAIQSARKARGLDNNNYAGQLAESMIQHASGNPREAQILFDKFASREVLTGNRTLLDAITISASKNI